PAGHGRASVPATQAASRTRPAIPPPRRPCVLLRPPSPSGYARSRVEPLRLAPGARADRLPRPRGGAGGARTPRRGRLARGAGVALRRGASPPDERGAVSGPPARVLRRGRPTGPGPEGGRTRSGGPGGLPPARRSPHAERATPRRLQLLHAAAAPGRDRGRGARGMDEPGHRPLALRHGRALRRGGGHHL